MTRQKQLSRATAPTILAGFLATTGIILFSYGRAPIYLPAGVSRVSAQAGSVGAQTRPPAVQETHPEAAIELHPKFKALYWRGPAVSQASAKKQGVSWGEASHQNGLKPTGAAKRTSGFAADLPPTPIIWQPPTRTPPPSQTPGGPTATPAATGDAGSLFEPASLLTAARNGIVIAVGGFVVLGAYAVSRALQRRELGRWVWQVRREIVNPLMKRKPRK